jgi:hypothetical protein
MDPKAGPLSNLSQIYFGNLDGLAKAYEPTLKGIGRLNLELMNFMTRRSQAWLEIPAQLSRCKTPQDLIKEQLRFWQTAASQYSDGSHRLAAAWGACAVMPGLNGALGNTHDLQRDFITFPEPKEAPPPAREKRNERRAAYGSSSTVDREETVPASEEDAGTRRFEPISRR